MNKAMEVTVQYVAEDYDFSRKLQNRYIDREMQQRWYVNFFELVWIIGLIWFVAIGVWVLNEFDDHSDFMNTSLALGIGLFTIICLVIRNFAYSLGYNSLYRPTEDLLKQQLVFVITPESLECRGEFSTEIHDWRGIRGVSSSRDYFIISAVSESPPLIPKRVFNTPDEMGQFRDLINEYAKAANRDEST